MISTLAPVALSKSGARRCRGSAIWGPVNVTTRIVVPLNWAFDVGVLELQATSKPTIRTRALARYRLITSVLLQNPKIRSRQTPSQGARCHRLFGCLTRHQEFVKLRIAQIGSFGA